MIFNGKTVLIYGYGSSGKAAANLLNRKGAHVKVYDDDFTKRDYIIFEEWATDFKDIDLVVISPAISNLKPEILELRLKGVPVISEIELGYECCYGEVVAITGTNGKTTTTMLCDKLLKDNGFSSYALGNIGTPFCEVADKLKTSDTAVLEVSSFQLESVKKFSPEISIFLNIEPDHLDRHKTIERYALIKSRIFENQDVGDTLIANIDDERIARLIKTAVCNIIPFSMEQKCNGCYMQDGNIYFKDEKLFSQEELPFSAKEWQNALATICFGMFKKIKPDQIKKTLIDFKKPPHRVELVSSKMGKNVFDDSKATNISATISACQSFVDDTVLILGGSDKGEEYPILFENVPKHIKRVLVCGENSKSIMHAASLKGYKAISLCDSLEVCVKKAFEGDEKNILFSPASKSFDSFHSYAERGDKFKEIVEKI